MDNNLELFVKLLTQYPVLWDRRLQSFRSKQIKENAWKIIAKTSGQTVSDAMSQFKALREKYRRETIKMEKITQSGFACSPKERWYLYDLCSFLKDVQKPRKTRTLYRTSNIESQDEQQSMEMFDTTDIILKVEDPLQGTSGLQNIKTISPPQSRSNTPVHVYAQKEITENIQKKHTLSSIVHEVQPRPTLIQSFCSHLETELSVMMPEDAAVIMDDMTMLLLQHKQKLRQQAK